MVKEHPVRFTLTLIGLAAAAVLSLLCWLVEGPLIEKRMAESMGVALREAQVSGVGIEMDGRDLTLSGSVASVEERDRAIEAAERLSGLNQRSYGIKVLSPTKGRSLLTARKLPTGRLELSGPVRQADHAELLTQAQEVFGATQVVDKTELSTSADGQAAQQLTQALPFVARFKNGEAISQPGQLTLRGLAPDLASVGETRRTLEAQLPDTELIVALDRTWAAEDFSVTVTRIGEGLRLEGAVANLSQHALLMQRAEELWGRGSVDDRIVVAAIEEAPDRNRCLRSAMTRLPELQAGVLVQSAEGLSVRGAVASTGVRDELEQRLTADCGQQELDIALPVALSTWECQARLNAMLVGEPIRFQTGQDLIAPASDSDLVRLAGTLKSCPGPQLQISGHSDNVGEPSANLELSERRASAVRARLIELGIPPERVEVVGLGETQPVVSNRTPVGRAKNRRIEFTLLEPAQ